MESLLLAVILLTAAASVAAWANTKTILERLDRLEAAANKEVIDQG